MSVINSADTGKGEWVMELCQFLFLKATGRRCSADFKPAQEPSQLEHKVEDHNLCGNEHITLQVLPGMENCRQGRWCRIQTSRSVPGVDELRELAPSSRWRNGNLVCAVNVRMELPPADQRMHDSRVAIGTGCVRGTCVRDKRITQLHRSLFLQHVGHSIPWPKNAACAGLKHLPHEPSAFSMCCWVVANGRKSGFSQKSIDKNSGRSPCARSAPHVSSETGSAGETS